MDFTEEEKEAIYWAMQALADSDERRNRDEVRKMTEVTSSIDFKISMDRLYKISQKESSDVYATIRSFNPDKKKYLKRILLELAVVDSQVPNSAEVNALYHITYFGEL